MHKINLLKTKKTLDARYSKKRLDELVSKEMSKLTELTKTYTDSTFSIRKMEMGYLKQVLLICLNLLKFVIEIKKEELKGKKPVVKDGEERIKNKGLRLRKYMSLFGVIEFSRPSFSSNQRGMLYLLDNLLEMPKELWSYNIQELIGENATETDFRESVNTLNKLFDLGLHDVGSKRNISQIGLLVDEYYEEKQVDKIPAPFCFSASFDGKGVPKIKPKEAGAVKEIKRLGKGEKRGIKQMATVGVMSYFEPKQRTISSIIKGLMGTYSLKSTLEVSLKQETKQANQKQEENDNRWHQGIHRRAFLANQEKSIDYGIGYIKSMMGHPESKFVVPVDAGIGLEEKILKYVKQHQVEDQFDGIILDIIHVSEYTWACANAVLGENSKLRTNWVKEMLDDLLHSKTTKVIADLQQIIDKGNLSKGKETTVQKAITYFTNHQHKMDYKTFLEKGYPISSALVESNCKHLVKDRMEQSGMRWSSKGAQNMLDTRAVKLNGDFEDFISFVQKKNKQKFLSIAA